MIPTFDSLEPRLMLDAVDPRVYIEVVPNDEWIDSQWGIAAISAPAAWETSTGSRDVVIAVLDTGVDYTHPDLIDNIWTNPGEIAGDGIDNDNNGFVDDVHGWDFAYNDNDPMDVLGHGTHVAGTIGATGNNLIGVSGVSWNVSILPVKFLEDSGSGWSSKGAAGIDYITMLARDYDVNVVAINASWGSQSYSSLVYNAIKAAGEQDILFVAAAGNKNFSSDPDKANQHLPHYPSGYDLDNIVSVAATTSADVPATWTTYGLISVDLAAPGSSIRSTTVGGGYGNMSGTSMAAPHVTGAVALLAAQYPELSHQRIKNDILQSVDVFDWSKGVASQGRLNVAAAMDALSGPEVVFDPPHVIDVDDLSADIAGSWAVSRQVPQYYGTGYLDDWGQDKGNGLVTFEVVPDRTGVWEVYMSYAGGTVIDFDGSRYTYAADVPVTVIYSGGQETFLVNEGPNSASWKSLGEYDLVAGETVTFTVGNSGTLDGWHVAADAFRMIYYPVAEVVAPPPPEAPIEVIVDNTDFGFSVDGIWKASGAVDSVNGSCVYGDTVGPVATWSTPLEAGVYEVSAFIPGIRANGSKYIRDYEADYSIIGLNGLTSYAIDQNDFISQWAVLGTVEFAELGLVKLRSDTDWRVLAGRPVADAIKWVWVSP